MSNNKNNNLEVLKKRIEEQKKLEQNRVEMEAEIKKKIIEQVEKGNPEKTNELAQLWTKYHKESEESKEKKSNKIAYKIGSALSGMVSGFKEGVNQKS